MAKPKAAKKILTPKKQVIVQQLLFGIQYIFLFSLSNKEEEETLRERRSEKELQFEEFIRR